jgi:hypothetical protein
MKKITLLVGIAVAAISANAQSLSQGTLSDNTFLALAGTPGNELYGVSFGDNKTNTTANGYVFYPSPNPAFGGPPNVSWNFSAGFIASFGTYNTGDPALDEVLHTGEGLDGSTTPTPLTLNNLTLGVTYNALIFTADNRTGISTPRNLTVSDGATNASQEYDFAAPDAQNRSGGYIMDTFLATGTTHAITIGGVGGDQVNGLLVVSTSGVTPPTAPTITFFGLSGLTVTIDGSNGPINTGYRILSSASVSVSKTNWTQAASGSFDGSGNFSTSFSASSGVKAAYYIVVTP